MSACPIVTRGDFVVRVKDGASFVKEIAMMGDVSISPGGWTTERHRNTDGSYAAYAPSRTEENVTTVSVQAKALGGLAGVDTSLQVLTLVQTHAASAVYTATLKHKAPGAVKWTSATLTFAAGATSADTDDNADAALVAMFPTAVVAHATPGTITATFPAGWSLKVFSSTLGTGTFTATVTATGGTAADELSIADLVNRSGHYEKLVPVLGTGQCLSEEKTLTWEIDAGGRRWTFPASTHTGSFAAPLTGMTVDLAIECPQHVPTVGAVV